MKKKDILKDLKQCLTEVKKTLEILKLQDIPGSESENLTNLTQEELAVTDIETIAVQLQEVKEKLPTEIPNLKIIEQYKELDDLYLKRIVKLQKITEERNECVVFTTRYVEKECKNF